METVRAYLLDLGEVDVPTVSLAEKRAERANDNSLWSPLECAMAFVRDVRKGEIVPIRLLALYEERMPDGGARVSCYSANVKRDTEIYLLHMRLHFATHKWENRP